MNEADGAGPRVGARGKKNPAGAGGNMQPGLIAENLVHQNGDREVYIVSQPPKIPASESAGGDFNKVNFWKEETSGVGDPRKEFLLEEMVRLLGAIEQRLGRLEEGITRFRWGRGGPRAQGKEPPLGGGSQV